MTNNYKLLSFIIALKRYRRNSVILDCPKYKLAQRLSLHPTTFKKYFDKCVELNWIKKIDNGWKIIKFEDILSGFCKESELRFNSHDILRNKNICFKDIYSQLCDCMILDSVITPQEIAISKKQHIIDLDKRINSSNWIKGNITRKQYDKYCRLAKKGCVDGAYDVNQSIISSSRATSTILGVSLARANKLLNTSLTFSRKINNMYFNGCNIFIVERLKALYSDALVIPLPYLGKTKVCFGSTLMRNQDLAVI